MSGDGRSSGTGEVSRRRRSHRTMTNHEPVGVSEAHLEEYEESRQLLRRTFSIANQRATDSIEFYKAKLIEFTTRLEANQKKKVKYELELFHCNKKIQELNVALKVINLEVEEVKSKCHKCKAKSVAYDFGDPDQCVVRAKLAMYQMKLKTLETKKRGFALIESKHKEYRIGVADCLSGIDSLIRRYQNQLRDLEDLIDQQDNLRGVANREIIRASIQFRRIYLGIQY